MRKVRFNSLLLCSLVLVPLFTLAEDAQPPAPPRVALCNPLAVSSGGTMKVNLRGWGVDKATAIKCDNDQVTLKILAAAAAPVPGKQDAKQIGDQQLELEVTTPADLAPGRVMLIIVSPNGESTPHALLIGGDVPTLAETEPNDGFRQSQAIATSQIIDGQIQSDGNVDLFSFEVTENTTLRVEVQAQQFGSCLDSLLTLYSDSGDVIASQDDQKETVDSLLEETLASGRYFIALQDAHDRGGPAHPYRLIVKPRGTPLAGQ